jgi:hypothetical protein
MREGQPRPVTERLISRYSSTDRSLRQWITLRRHRGTYMHYLQADGRQAEFAQFRMQQRSRLVSQLASAAT